MLEDKNGKFRLSPAYDLLNTHIHVDDSVFALSKGLFTKPKPEYFGISSAVTGKTFQVFGEIINLPTNLAGGLLDKFCAIHPLIDELIEHSFLSDTLKKEYKSMYKSRINSFLSMR